MHNIEVGVSIKYGAQAFWHLRQLFVKIDVWAMDPESEDEMFGVNTTQQLWALPPAHNSAASWHKYDTVLKVTSKVMSLIPQPWYDIKPKHLAARTPENYSERIRN